MLYREIVAVSPEKPTPPTLVIRPDSRSWHTLRASWSHSYTPHSVGLLWSNDQPNAQTSYLTTHNIHNRQTYMSRRDSNSISASEWAHTQSEEPAIHTEHKHSLWAQIRTAECYSCWGNEWPTSGLAARVALCCSDCDPALVFFNIRIYICRRVCESASVN